MIKDPPRNRKLDDMDVISLPVVEAGTSLRIAVAEMKRAKRTGLIVRRGIEARLVRAADFRFAAKTRATLEEIEGLPVHVFDVTPIAQSTPEPYISTDVLQRALQTSGQKIGLLVAPTATSKRAIIYGDIHTLFYEPRPGRRKKVTG